jgi:hypothetical protein
LVAPGLSVAETTFPESSVNLSQPWLLPIVHEHPVVTCSTPLLLPPTGIEAEVGESV